MEVYVRGEASGSGQKIAADGIVLYEITQDEYDAIAKMTPEQVAEPYPYVDSMTNVKNPYAIVTGGNLLPPFIDGWSPQGVVKVTSPYEAELTPTTNEVTALWCDIPTSPNTDYILSIDQNGATMSVTGGADGTIIVDNTAATSAKFNSGDRNTIRVYVSNYSEESETPSIGNFTFKNPMLTIGTEPKPFTPQQRSMLAFETELAANPVDGSNPDILFIGDDGLPYVLENWGKVVLDGGLTWGYSSTFSSPGFKAAYVDGLINATLRSGIVAKYDGTLLALDSALGSADTQNGINNTGTGTRWWVRRGETSWTGATASTPTTQALINSNWQPYRLQYLKAKPTVEPVRNYEMGVTHSAGSNMVEVGSGIVIRERAYPVYNGVSNWFINRDDSGFTASRLNHKASKISNVYRDGQIDSAWAWTANVTSYGKDERFLADGLF
ncbi:hypothetical protein ABEX25_25755 [Paenibacillus thiaminolyticus]|uniref:hypothetical protein n=1 Tax=Paenibacillus thiaminolyticus TaxID=49283 RepID=UPI003D2ADD08